MRTPSKYSAVKNLKRLSTAWFAHPGFLGAVTGGYIGAWVTASPRLLLWTVVWSAAFASYLVGDWLNEKIDAKLDEIADE